MKIKTLVNQHGKAGFLPRLSIIEVERMLPNSTVVNSADYGVFMEAEYIVVEEEPPIDAPE